MADIYGVSPSNIVTSVRTLSTLRSSSSGTSASNAELPESLKSPHTATHRAVVPPDKVSSFLSAAEYVGSTIVGILKSLKTAVSLAGSSQTNSYANMHVASGTRVSVGNISADVTRTLNHVQELVDKAGLGSTNILSSSSSDLTLKTTVYGGSINVTPQPLDLKGLNLEDINLHTSDGLQDALTRIGIAISLAEQRVSNIQQLDNALNGTSPLTSAVRNVSATGQSELRGVLVNFFA